jgi:hypothetical protein
VRPEDITRLASMLGWLADLPHEDVLARLLALNLERAADHVIGTAGV